NARVLPSAVERVEPTGERLALKAEREIRHIPTREREWQIDRLVGLVRVLAASEEGQRELAAVAAAYLREHKPETTVHEDAASAGPYDAARERAPERRDGGRGGGRSGGGGRGRGRGGRGRRGGGRR